MQDEVFAAPLDAGEGVAADAVQLGGVQRLAQFGDVRADAVDAAVFEVRCDAAAGGFDFGEFGHGRVLYGWGGAMAFAAFL